jgi:PEP-CTERM motif
MKKYVLLISAMMLPATGGSFVYTSLSAWQASSPGSTAVLDFESTSPAFFSSFSSGVFAFTSTASGLFVLNGAAAGTGSGHYLTTSGGTDLTITFASGVYGAAFNLGSNSAAAASASIVAIDVNGVQYSTGSFTTSGPAGPAAFWGLRNDVQLASLKITFASGAQPQVDNVRYSNIALPPQGPVIPEPGTWWLAGSGVALLLIRRRPANARCGGSSKPDA